MRNKEQRYKQTVITICCTDILGKTLLDKWCKSLVAEQELVFTNKEYISRQRYILPP